MKFRTAARNASLAAGTVLEHLGDDPVVLGLQVSRRIPGRVLDPLVRTVERVAAGTVLGPLAAVVRGEKETAERRLTAALSEGAAGRRALHFADVATAAGFGDLADRLITAAEPGTRGLPGTLARRRWYDGDMTGAVEVLESGSRAERRQQRRLASELAVFEGWQPILDPVKGYVPNPETVLHVLTNSLPHTGSGYAQRTHSILKAQSERGWSVHAVTRPGYPVQVGKLLARDIDSIDGVTYNRLLPARLPFGMQQRLQQQAELTLALALKTRPAILHTTTHFVNGLVTAAVAEALRIPWIYEVRGQLADTWASTRPEEARRSERYRLFREREADVMGRAALVPTLGTVMAEQISSSGVPRERIRLLPNAVGEGYLETPLPPAEARRALGLDPDTELIGTVSSLVDYEGLDDLIAAFGLVAGQHRHLNCLIVGDGAAAPGLKALTAELGLTGRVIFTGRVPREQAHLYHQALDVFVVPRKDLNVTRVVTPLKPVEAMACSRPVIASHLPALGELVRHAENGLLVRPSDPAHLADAIDALMSDPAYRAVLGSRGRSHVLATRTWGSAAEQTTEWYRALAGAA
ncbi:glycosyltransferase family 4 protein [Arthrobacter zhangbolii]|uniref:D-inositol 3-phosphate glycosyltransferase n=1 Tax=Arthrobacter zhangbolii TaxID=2886936 RepID=A0A9X1S888_9MICC|nr:glycosyltransferase family 4 protein [Arthrobacter zhangbolii]MCC3271136.1 glycosyltransferase family 4 protein [Arthrobacter zhangbolii]UON91068.1 glycosyltransferase family 4 protein [Arthrobacter zhangbolii]